MNLLDSTKKTKVASLRVRIKRITINSPRKVKSRIIKRYTIYADRTRPSFLEGLARIVDITGALGKNKSSDTGQNIDRQAIKLDWEEIGNDITVGINNFKKELKQQVNDQR